MDKNAYYFREGEDTCYKIEAHLQYMIENGITQMDIHLAARETNTPYFYCKHFQEVGEKTHGGCGKSCEAYKPKNGKSGACKHLGYTYEQTDKTFTLTINSITPKP